MSLLVQTTQIVCQPKMEVGELQLDNPRDYVEKVVPEYEVKVCHGAVIEVVRRMFCVRRTVLVRELYHCPQVKWFIG